MSNVQNVWGCQSAIHVCLCVCCRDADSMHSKNYKIASAYGSSGTASGQQTRYVFFSSSSSCEVKGPAHAAIYYAAGIASSPLALCAKMLLDSTTFYK